LVFAILTSIRFYNLSKYTLMSYTDEETIEVPSKRGAYYFRTGGTLSATEPSYIVRKADDDLLRLLVSGEFSWVLDSRQKGKSSLLVRIANQLAEKEIRVIKLDLQRFGANLTEEQWYAALTRAVDDQFPVPGGVLEHWRSRSEDSPAVRWLAALESLTGEEVPPLVVFIDEVDYVRSLPFDTDEFFAVIGACYDRRATDPNLLKLTFCLAGNSTPSQLLRKPHTSFSVFGKRVELLDFSPDELKPYGEVLSKLGHDGPAIVRQVHQWTSGQPFLTQLACSEYLERRGGLHEYFRREFVLPRQRQQNDHIASIGYSLTNPSLPGVAPEEARVQVLDAYLQLLRTEPRSADQFNPIILDHLRLCGLVTEREGRVWVRNRVYRETFNRNWVLEQLPAQEKVRQARAARKATLVTTGIALGAIAIVGGFSLNSYQLVRKLQAALQESEASSNRARQEAYVGTFQSISAEVQDGNTMRAGLLLSQIEQSPFRGWEWNRMQRALNQHRFMVDVGSPVMGVIPYGSAQPKVVMTPNSVVHFTPSGEVEKTISLPQASTSAVNTGMGLLLKYRDWSSMLYREDGSSLNFRSVIALLSADRQIFANKTRNAIRLEDWAGNPRGPWVYPSRTTGITGRNPKEFVVELRGGWWLVDMTTGKPQVELYRDGMINALVFSRDQKTAIIATNEPDVLIFDLERRVVVGKLRGNQGPVNSMAISRDESRLVTGGADGIVRVFEISTMRLLREFVGHKNRIQYVGFSSDEKSLISSGSDHSVRTWDINMANVQQLLNDSSNGVARIKIAAGQDSMASIFNDGTIKFWTYGQIQPSATTKLPVRGEIINSDFSEDGWVEGAMETGACFRTNGVVLNLLTPPRAAVGVITLRDRDSVIVVGLMGEVMRGGWTGGKSQLIRGPQSRVRSIAANAKRTHFSIGYENGKVEVWDVKSDLPLSVTQGESRVAFMQFSPDGTRLAAATYGQEALEIPVTAEPKVVRLQGHTSRLFRSVYSPDGKWIATSSFDNSARLWESGTGREVFAIQLKSWVGDVSFSPDGQRLLTACGDGSARLWSVATGREIMVVQRSPIPLFGCRMSPDGNWIVTSDSEGRIRAWNGSPVPSSPGDPQKD
jgi:WD40 repeat protein